MIKGGFMDENLFKSVEESVKKNIADFHNEQNEKKKQAHIEKGFVR